MRDPNYPAHPFGLGIKIGVSQEAANEGSHFILPDIGQNRAIASMTEGRVIETCVAGEKRGIAPPTRRNDYLLVLQALATKVETNLPRRQPPRLEQQALSVKDVLVEDDQA